jgi:hypothetical protein
VNPDISTWINNDSPGFLPDGTVETAGIAEGGSIPPSSVRTLGEALNEKHISWAYYGGADNAAVQLQHNPYYGSSRPGWGGLLQHLQFRIVCDEDHGRSGAAGCAH